MNPRNTIRQVKVMFKDFEVEAMNWKAHMRQITNTPNSYIIEHPSLNAMYRAKVTNYSGEVIAESTFVALCLCVAWLRDHGCDVTYNETDNLIRKSS